MVQEDHLVGREAALRPLQADGQEAGVRRGAAELGEHDVRVPLDEERVAGPAEDLERDLVRHRRGREEDGLVLPEELGAAALELVDGRVLPLLLVADGGVGDRLAHRRGRPGQRVGAEIDHAIILPLSTRPPVG